VSTRVIRRSEAPPQCAGERLGAVANRRSTRSRAGGEGGKVRLVYSARDAKQTAPIGPAQFLRRDGRPARRCVRS
jgi:hypothetical protein